MQTDQFDFAAAQHSGAGFEVRHDLAELLQRDRAVGLFVRQEEIVADNHAVSNAEKQVMLGAVVLQRE